MDNFRDPGPEEIATKLIENKFKKLFEARIWCFNQYLNGAV